MESTSKVGEMVQPDGSVEELHRQVDPEQALSQTQYGIAEHLRAIVAIAKHEANTYRETDPVYARSMSIVRSKSEEALLYTLFGSRVG